MKTFQSTFQPPPVVFFGICFSKASKATPLTRPPWNPFVVEPHPLSSPNWTNLLNFWKFPASPGLHHMSFTHPPSVSHALSSNPDPSPPGSRPRIFWGFQVPSENRIGNGSIGNPETLGHTKRIFRDEHVSGAPRKSPVDRPLKRKMPGNFTHRLSTSISFLDGILNHPKMGWNLLNLSIGGLTFQGSQAFQKSTSLSFNDGIQRFSLVGGL